jgi:hypothetical protein
LKIRIVHHGHRNDCLTRNFRTLPASPPLSEITVVA